MCEILTPIVALRPAPRVTCVLLVVSLAACGGGSSQEPDASTGDPDSPVGTFAIDLVAARDQTPAYTSLVGIVYDGPQPYPVIWEQADQSGDCVLLTPRVPFCETPCGGSALCVEDDECQAYPSKQDVGTVHVSGLETEDGDSTFDISPIASTYQIPASISLVYPPFAEGDSLSLQADGSDFTSAFTLTTTGIAPLTLTSADPDLQPNTAVELTWTAPATETGATVSVKLDISHHGGTQGKIECAGDDDGSMTIDASLITQLLDLGAAGYPTIVVNREATGSAVISAGRVDLDVTSSIERPVTVPGIVSCTGDEDCDDGQTCRDDLTCG